MQVGDCCVRDVATITAGSSLRVAARQMRDLDVGSLVVVRRGVPEGLLSDRDLALAVMGSPARAPSTRVESVAEKHPACIGEDRSLREGMQRLRRDGVRRLPVIDANGLICGLLSMDDLLLIAIDELGGLATAVRKQAPGAGAIRAPRTARSTPGLRREVVTIPVEASAWDAARVMSECGVGSLVVVDNARPVGLLTARDLALRVVAEGGPRRSRPLRDVMSAPLHTIDLETPIHRAVATMAEHGIRRVPVLEGEELAGIVSLDDLVIELSGTLRDLSQTLGRCRAFPRPGGRVVALAREFAAGAAELGGLVLEAGDGARERFRRDAAALRERVAGNGARRPRSRTP